MARILIRQAHGGQTRIISDPALPYFLNQGWVVLDDYDDAEDIPPVYLSRAEGDLRWASIADLGDPESAEVVVISEAVADVLVDPATGPGGELRAAFVSGLDAAPTLSHDFSAKADTAAGGIGSPDVGGAWTLTGVGAATARILDGQFVSPGGVTYAYQTLAATPVRSRTRFVLTSAGVGATVAFSSDATLNIPTADMVHVVHGQNDALLTIFINGVNTQLVNQGTNTGVAALTLGVEYEADVLVDGDTITVNYYEVSTGLLVRSASGSDSRVPAAMGPLVFIEPGAGASFTFAAFYPEQETRLRGVATASGFRGPVGTGHPEVGLFKRVGVGTQSPTTDFHLVSTANVPVIVESSHSSGALLRVTSTVSAVAGIQLKANNAATPARVYMQNVTNELRLATGGSDRLEVTTDGFVKMMGALCPAALGNTKQTAVGFYAGTGVPSNASGGNGYFYFRSDGAGALERVYFKTGGAWVGIL